LGRRLGPRRRVAEGAVVVARRVAVAGAARGDQLAGELIERLFVDERLAYPAVEQADGLGREELLLGPQQVGTLHRPGGRKLVPLQQLIDESGALVGPLVGEEAARLGRRG